MAHSVKSVTDLCFRNMKLNYVTPATVIIAGSLNVPLVWHYLSPAAGCFYLCIYVLVFLLTSRSRNLFEHNQILAAVVVFSFCFQMICLFAISPVLHNGMDRDSAMITWIHRLFNGKFPYEHPTRNGNPISVLPFMPIVAIPFYLLGNVGLLEPAAYLLLVLLLYRTYRNNEKSRLYSILILSTIPLTFFEVLARSDLIANITILLLVIYILELKQSSLESNKILLGILLGCAASTRIAMLPATVVILLAVFKNVTPRVFAEVVFYCILTMGCLILPFLAWNSFVFVYYAPLGVNLQKLGPHESLRSFWLSITIIAVFLTAFLARKPSEIYLSVTVTLAIVTLATWSTFWVDLSYLQLICVPLLFSFPRGQASCAHTGKQWHDA